MFRTHSISLTLEYIYVHVDSKLNLSFIYILKHRILIAAVYLLQQYLWFVLQCAATAHMSHHSSRQIELLSSYILYSCGIVLPVYFNIIQTVNVMLFLRASSNAQYAQKTIFLNVLQCRSEYRHLVSRMQYGGRLKSWLSSAKGIHALAIKFSL